MTLEIKDQEVYADELDRAAAVSDAHNQSCIADAQYAARPQQHQLPDGSWPITACITCGDDIPEGRVALAKIKCLSCQESEERKGAMYAR